jgi:hypothetical protein
VAVRVETSLWETVDAALCEEDRDGVGEARGILICEAPRIEPSEFG